MSTADAEAAKRAEADLIGAEIAQLAAQATLTEAQILARVRDVDARGLWQATGQKSCAHWLAWWLKLDLDTARERVRVARKLGKLPPIAKAFEAGRLSYSQARALSRVASMENAAQLLEIAGKKTAVELEQICRRFGRHLAAEAPPRPSDRYLRSKRLDNGLVRIDSALFPDEAQRVLVAIETIMRAATCPPAPPAEGPPPDPSAEVCPQPTVAERRADGLVAMADHFLADPERELSRSVRQELTIIVDEATLEGREPAEGKARCELVDGTPVAVETIERLTCNTPMRRVTVDAKGTPIDVGRKSRAIPDRLMKALVTRDGCCRFPGCTSRAFADGHHIIPWARGGPTNLANLALHCGYHHRLIHEGGYRCGWVGDELVHFTPEGKQLPRAPVPRDADLDAIAFAGGSDALVG